MAGKRAVTLTIGTDSAEAAGDPEESDNWSPLVDDGALDEDSDGAAKRTRGRGRGRGRGNGRVAGRGRAKGDSLLLWQAADNVSSTR